LNGHGLISVKTPVFQWENNMKTQLLLGLALVLCGGLAQARAVRLWSETDLTKAADLVVVAAPLATKDLAETNSLGWSQTGSFKTRFRGVETIFKVDDVLKGMPANDRIILHHYRYENDWGSPPNGPDFINLNPGDTNKLVLYLVKDGPERYAPVTGQVDSAPSVRPLTADSPYPFHMPVLPPIADASPEIRYPVQIHIPVRLHAVKTNDAIWIETAEMTLTNLTVGTNMVTGTECETQAYQDGQLLGTGGSSLQGGLADGGFSDKLLLNFEKSLRADRSIALEITITMFETDEPAQHFWSPQSGHKYHVLLKQTFKLVVD
jgi:hypothetical protein